MTVVSRTYRKQGLAAWMKCYLLSFLEEKHPNISSITTENAHWNTGDRDFNVNRLERYLSICYSSNVQAIGNDQNKKVFQKESKKKQGSESEGLGMIIDEYIF